MQYSSQVMDSTLLIPMGKCIFKIALCGLEEPGTEPPILGFMDAPAATATAITF